MHPTYCYRTVALYAGPQDRNYCRRLIIGVKYRRMFLRVVLYFDKPAGRVKFKERVKIYSDPSYGNI